MSNIFKGAAKVAGAVLAPALAVSKQIFSGVKKAFKALTSTTLGRVLLIGATIYLGGAAFGMWQSPFAAVNGAFVGGAAAGETSAAAAALDSGAAAGGAAEGATAGLDAAAGGASGAAAGDTAAAELSASSAGAGTAGADAAGAAGDGWAAGATPGTMTTPGGMTANSSGLINGAAKSAGWFSSLNPMAQFGLIQTGAGALQNAFQPNAIDVANREAELKRQNAEWQQNFLAPNFNVGSLSVGTPSGQPLYDQNGNPVYPPQPQGAQVPQLPTPQGGGLIRNAMAR